jgi:hypothetical protein
MRVAWIGKHWVTMATLSIGADGRSLSYYWKMPKERPTDDE